MSDVTDWISELIDMYSRHDPDLDHKDCKLLADLLQERLDCAEKLYNVNAQLSIRIMHNKGLTPAQTLNVNLLLVALIKQLRGGDKKTCCVCNELKDCFMNGGWICESCQRKGEDNE